MTHSRAILLQAMKLLDLLLMAAGFLAGVLFLLPSNLDSVVHILSLKVTVRNVLLFLAFAFTWHASFSFFGIYNSRRLSTAKAEAKDVLTAATSAAAVIGVVSLWFGLRVVPLAAIVVFWLAATALTLSVRLALRLVLARFRRRGRNQRHIVVVGTNERALRFCHDLQEHPETGYQVIGFIDDDWPGMEAFRKAGYPLLGDLQSFERCLSERPADEVIVCLPTRSHYREAAEILRLCEELAITVRFPAAIFDAPHARAVTEDFKGTPITTFYRGTADGVPMATKRLIDIIVSAALLVLLSPLFLAIALLISLTSPGPVFFTKVMLGRNRRPFTIVKFRTMIQGADSMMEKLAHLNTESGAGFKIRDDPRVTPIGRMLRRTSIDELPQLWNVLRGDMSMVGPRPLCQWEYERIQNAWVKRRFSVKPGLTGLWQVSGRNDIPFEGRIRLDLEYIDNWTLLLDCRLLLQTIPAVFTGRGAV